MSAQRPPQEQRPDASDAAYMCYDAMFRTVQHCHPTLAVDGVVLPDNIMQTVVPKILQSPGGTFVVRSERREDRVGLRLVCDYWTPGDINAQNRICDYAAFRIFLRCLILQKSPNECPSIPLFRYQSSDGSFVAEPWQEHLRRQQHTYLHDGCPRPNLAPFVDSADRTLVRRVAYYPPAGDERKRCDFWLTHIGAEFSPHLNEEDYHSPGDWIDGVEEAASASVATAPLSHPSSAPAHSAATMQPMQHSSIPTAAAAAETSGSFSPATVAAAEMSMLGFTERDMLMREMLQNQRDALDAQQLLQLQDLDQRYQQLLEHHEPLVRFREQQQQQLAQLQQQEEQQQPQQNRGRPQQPAVDVIERDMMLSTPEVAEELGMRPEWLSFGSQLAEIPCPPFAPPEGVDLRPSPPAPFTATAVAEQPHVLARSGIVELPHASFTRHHIIELPHPAFAAGDDFEDESDDEEMQRVQQAMFEGVQQPEESEPLVLQLDGGRHLQQSLQPEPQQHEQVLQLHQQLEQMPQLPEGVDPEVVLVLLNEMLDGDQREGAISPPPTLLPPAHIRPFPIYEDYVPFLAASWIETGTYTRRVADAYVHDRESEVAAAAPAAPPRPSPPEFYSLDAAERAAYRRLHADVESRLYSDDDPRYNNEETEATYQAEQRRLREMFRNTRAPGDDWVIAAGDAAYERILRRLDAQIEYDNANAARAAALPPEPTHTSAQAPRSPPAPRTTAVVRTIRLPGSSASRRVEYSDDLPPTFTSAARMKRQQASRDRRAAAMQAASAAAATTSAGSVATADPQQLQDDQMPGSSSSSYDHERRKVRRVLDEQQQPAAVAAASQPAQPLQQQRVLGAVVQPTPVSAPFSCPRSTLPMQHATVDPAHHFIQQQFDMHGYSGLRNLHQQILAMQQRQQQYLHFQQQHQQQILQALRQQINPTDESVQQMQQQQPVVPVDLQQVQQLPVPYVSLVQQPTTVQLSGVAQTMQAAREQREMRGYTTTQAPTQMPRFDAPYSMPSYGSQHVIRQPLTAGPRFGPPSSFVDHRAQVVSRHNVFAIPGAALAPDTLSQLQSDRLMANLLQQNENRHLQMLMASVVPGLNGGEAAPVGATQKDIEKHTTTSLWKATEGEPAATCTVCMCEFEDEDKVRAMTCTHAFHTECIDRWLSYNKKCPNCRVDLDQNAAPVTAAAAAAAADDTISAAIAAAVFPSDEETRRPVMAPLLAAAEEYNREAEAEAAAAAATDAAITAAAATVAAAFPYTRERQQRQARDSFISAMAESTAAFNPVLGAVLNPNIPQ